MVDNVDICNAALIKIGDKIISSLTEDNPSARRLNIIFNQQRDYLLRSHPWNFAIARVQLAELTVTPNFEFTHQYQLPVDFLSVVEIYNDPDAIYRIEDGKILTDLSKVQLVYIKKVTDPNKFDPHFTQALSALLAVEIAYSRSANPTLTAQVEVQARKLVKEAKRFDSANSSIRRQRDRAFLPIDNDPNWNI